MQFKNKQKKYLENYLVSYLEINELETICYQKLVILQTYYLKDIQNYLKSI